MSLFGTSSLMTVLYLQHNYVSLYKETLNTHVIYIAEYRALKD